MIDIDSIDKKRFQEKCNICGLSSQGPTMKCENEKCHLKFHVECARINKYQLEMVNNSQGEVKQIFNF
jgi:ribosome-binding protein aMBF1 (putative translation factor)